MSSSLLAVDWSEYGQPCETEDQTTWKGPYEYVLCMDGTGLCEECCYKFIYYERFAEGGTGW